MFFFFLFYGSEMLSIFGTFLVYFVCSGSAQDLDEGCFSLHTKQHGTGRPTTIHVLETGNLYSPGFPQNGVPFQQCNYVLRAPLGMFIRLKFNLFELQPEGVCQGDALYLLRSDGSILSLMCGQHQPRDFVSPDSTLQIVFRKSLFGSGRGFNITYSLQDRSELCPAGMMECRNRNCVSSSKSCNGIDDCEDGTDEQNCEGGGQLEVGDCGVPVVDPLSAHADRVVGGQIAAYGSWPWMASLQIGALEPCGHVCGGSLINSQWVLTAMHCFLPAQLRSTESLRVHLGIYNKFEKDSGEQVRWGERVILYGDRSLETLTEENLDLVNDIALIKLNAPVKFTQYVRPICLPETHRHLNLTTDCYATGWGDTRGSGGSDRLKQAFHPVQADIMCRRRVGQQFNNSTMICAGSMAPLSGVCHGDSGGPLSCKFNGRWEILGAASYVTDNNFMWGVCGLDGRPSVFNKVAVKLDWIRRTIDENT